MLRDCRNRLALYERDIACHNIKSNVGVNGLKKDRGKRQRDRRRVREDSVYICKEADVFTCITTCMPVSVNMHIQYMSISVHGCVCLFGKESNIIDLTIGPLLL